MIYGMNTKIHATVRNSYISESVRFTSWNSWFFKHPALYKKQVTTKNADIRFLFEKKTSTVWLKASIDSVQSPILSTTTDLEK